MKKFIRGALLAGAAIIGSTGAASAEGAWSGNVALTTDYVFRGISQSDGNPAIQGGFDYVNGIFYAGAWASNVAFSSGPEIDLYAGVTPTVGPVALNFGVLGYFYPGADDEVPETFPGISGDGIGEFDYYEVKGAASIAPADGFTLGAAAYYSPEFFAETGSALYLEVSGAFTISEALAISAAYGNQSIDDVNGLNGGETEGDYNTWNLGATYALHGFSLDLRYIDTDIDPADAIGTFATADETLYDSAAVFTIKRAL